MIRVGAGRRSAEGPEPRFLIAGRDPQAPPVLGLHPARQDAFALLSRVAHRTVRATIPAIRFAPGMPGPGAPIERMLAMRCKSLRILAVFGLFSLFVMPAPAVRAAPADIDRAPDVTFNPCVSGQSGAKCVARGVGDFNGDGVDDVIFERASFGDVFGHGMMTAVRPFEIHFGPFRAAPAGKPAAAEIARLSLTASRALPPLTIADIDNDGSDDIAIPLTMPESAEQGQARPQTLVRVAILLGRPHWQADWDLLRGENATIRIEQKVSDMVPSAGGFEVPSASVAFADANRDGFLDIVLGLDAVPLSNTALGAPGVVPPGVPPPAPGSALPPRVDSRVAVMYGDGTWPAYIAFEADVLHGDLGQCTKALAGAGDVTGDGVADLLIRRCPGEKLPDQLEVIPGPGPSIGCPGVPGGSIQPIEPDRPFTTLDGDQPAYADGDVPPPGIEPGRGYLPASDSGGQPFFLEDVNADGVADILLPVGRNTHVWLGGHGVAEKIARNRSDRIFVGAGFGEMGRAGGWHSADLNGDGGQDWLLTDAPPQIAATAKAPGSSGLLINVPPSTIHIYRDGRPSLDVLDTTFDAPEARWEKPELAVWGMGDFNGDGRTDLLLGDAFGNIRRSQYGVMFGPITGW